MSAPHVSGVIAVVAAGLVMGNVGARRGMSPTTRLALLTSPLRDRFGAIYRLDFYSTDAMQQIIERSGRILGVSTDAPGARNY